LASIQINEQLLLRAFEVDEFQQLFDAIHASRQHLTPWLNWVAKTTRAEHSLEFIQQAQQQRHNQEALALGIFLNNTIIGGVGMHDWNQQTGVAQIGYWISKDYEGKGIVKASVRGLVAYLFGTIGLNKIEIHFVPANKRSAVIAEQLGFRVEGVLRQRVLRNGMLEDLVVTGLLKEEWKTRQS
jgi:ribosomal-protein-serine acetyltransferase